MARYRTPKERFRPLLALRTRDRGMLTRKDFINVLAFALAIDPLITPTIPQPVRKDFMIALLGQRFMGVRSFAGAAHHGGWNILRSP